MLVRQILNSKPDSTVVSIGPDASVGEAAGVLSARRIGALVVSTDGRHVEGILSERDIVRELGKHGAECLARPVRALMTAKLTTTTVDEDAREVLERMTEGRFRHMPVMEGDVMIGVISIGDVVKARLSELSMERDALEGMIAGT